MYTSTQTAIMCMSAHLCNLAKKIQTKPRRLSYRSLSIKANPIIRCIQERKLPPFQSLKIVDMEPAVTKFASNFVNDLKNLESILGRKSASGEKIKCDDLLFPIEMHSDPLERTWGIVTHLMSVQNSDNLRKVHDKLQPLVIKTFMESAQSKTLYNSYLHLRNGDEWEKLSVEQQRVVDLSLRSASLSGVGLEGKDKEKFNNLKLKLAELSSKFAVNLLDSTKHFALLINDKHQLSGIPSSLLQLMSQNAREDGELESSASKGPWKITLDPPCYTQFMKFSANRQLREVVYKAFTTRASKDPFNNQEVALEILKLRKELAGLLGFDTFAELSIAKKMADSVTDVEKMHENLKAKCLDLAKKEISDISNYAAKNGQFEPLAAWDVSYWSEKLKSELFDFTEEELKPYFPMERVLEGLFELTSKLFGVIVEAVDGEVEVWNKDVRFFNIRSSDGDKILASFYLDPFSRPKEKNGGAWMNVCVNRSRFLGPVEMKGLRIPVAYLVCNQSPPVGDTPSLMTFREVETLFHEFGHGLQHMLTTASYGAVAGINGVEWDAVELPSQMMENFCYEKATINLISEHYKTGEALPNTLFEKLCSARKFMAASTMMRQLGFGALDMYLHHHYNPYQTNESIFEVQNRILKDYSPLVPLEEDRFLCSFSHIFAGGYSAGYYSYKWAEVLSCDAFEAFKEKLSSDKSALTIVGKRFRETVLARGGAQHPLEVFKEFRGRKPSIIPLLKQYGLNE